jgi:hypothetical protein
VAAFHRLLPWTSYSSDRRANATALGDGKGCLTKASSSFRVFVVYGDRFWRACAVAMAKSQSMLAIVNKVLSPPRAGYTQYWLHALVGEILPDRLQWSHRVRRCSVEMRGFVNCYQNASSWRCFATARKIGKAFQDMAGTFRRKEGAMGLSLPGPHSSSRPQARIRLPYDATAQLVQTHRHLSFHTNILLFTIMAHHVVSSRRDSTAVPAQTYIARVGVSLCLPSLNHRKTGTREHSHNELRHALSSRYLRCVYKLSP